MFNKDNVKHIIQRAIQFKLIRVDSMFTKRGAGYDHLLEKICELLISLEHGVTIRKMMYEYKDTVPVDDQLAVCSERKRKDPYNRLQTEGLGGFQQASGEMASHEETLHPNILVNCDSGRTGELGCREGYIKVYQAVYAPSYGESDYKDVYIHKIHRRDQLIIQPARGGKCNVSIGNPYRIVGWFFNYLQQGSTDALIRMWEIPQEVFNRILRVCGTEWQIGQERRHNSTNKFAEICDLKSTNQFGLWTHDKRGKPTKFGQRFMESSQGLVTYYDPKGTHVRSERDGDLRPIGWLLKSLGIPVDWTLRYHDLSTCLSGDKGNLLLNEKTEQTNAEVLELINMMRMPGRQGRNAIAQLTKENVRVFCNLLTYNGLNPQNFNLSKSFTTGGLCVENLRYESQFMIQVFRSYRWYRPMENILKMIRGQLQQNNRELPSEIRESLPKQIRPQALATYMTIVDRISLFIMNCNRSFDSQNVIIDAFNVILRPLCSGNILDSIKTAKSENFIFKPLSDLQYKVGVSHRVGVGSLTERDSLDGNRHPGFIRSHLFQKALASSTRTSNTQVQLSKHDRVVTRLNDRNIPVMGGISGTTRDIFRCFYEVPATDFWPLFSVVSAFMIKHHYHSLAECYIAAEQFYQRNGPKWANEHFRGKLTAMSLYRHIRDRTGIQFLQQ